MLIGNKNCDKCGSSYDIARDTCPACNTPNEEKKAHKSMKWILFLSPLKQLSLFLVGFVVLQVLGFLVSSVLDNFMSAEEVRYHVITNWVCYGTILIACCLIIFKDFKLFKRFVTNPIPYAIGLGAGALLFVLSLSYNAITSLLIPHEVNENQSIANAMMSGFPISSIIVIGFIGPICEEITYRLGMYSFLRRINKWVAYLVTILFFAAIHINFFSEDLLSELISLPSYLLAGFTFCILYEKCGIAGSLTAHITNNLAGVLITILINLIRILYGAA